MLNASTEKARIWFFTDIHGSNACFRKFLNLANDPIKPNVLIIGADITGKQIIPIVESTNNTFSVKLGGYTERIKSSDLALLEKRLSDVGYYTYVCSQNDFNSFMFSSGKKREIFDRLAKARLEEWIKLANERLPPTDICKVIINAGNDDPFFVDALLDKCPKIIRPEGKVIDLPANLKLLSTGYSTETPWECPRDISEDQMTEKIEAMTGLLNHGDKYIFNFHCPPYKTSLDQADYIDPETLIPSPGNKISAGSISVKKAIEIWQPIAGLHGHIHEVHSKQVLGKTVCFNPGTDYKNGKLQGVFLQINQAGEIELAKLTEERNTEKLQIENKKVLNKALSSIPFVGKFLEENDQEKKFDLIETELKKISENLNNK